MRPEERLEAIGRFEASFGLVEELVAKVPDEALAFVPDLPEAWSIRDHLVHLLDAESAVYFRLRLAIAEPGSSVQPWEEVAWHERLAYASSDGRACLAAAKALRTALCATLRARAGDDWSQYWLEHPARGRLELERLVEMYREHLAFHVPYIKRNVDAWKAAQGRT